MNHYKNSHHASSITTFPNVNSPNFSTIKLASFSRRRKNSLLLVVFLSVPLLVTAPCYAQPSLDETVEWLKERLVGSSATYQNIVRSDVFTEVTTIKSFSVDRGVLRLSTQLHRTSSLIGADITFPISEAEVPLRDLYATCTVRRGYCPGTQCPELPYELRIAGRNKHSLFLMIDDADLARRVGNALEHLIKLSGGKEDIFK